MIVQLVLVSFVIIVVSGSLLWLGLYLKERKTERKEPRPLSCTAPVGNDGTLDTAACESCVSFDEEANNCLPEDDVVEYETH